MRGERYAVAIIEACQDQLRSEGEQAVADLYTGALFHAALQWSVRECRAAIVVSPRHGVVEIGERLAPYHLTIEGLTPAERRAWAARVAAYCLEWFPPGAAFVLLTGDRCARLLSRALARACPEWTIAAPLFRLAPRARVLWFNRRGRVGGRIAHALRS